ncbi:bifunctional demethylmenaquinone methyltransferase/2-methoxy-6-polyprenyl-1,4-benzoquinol methylase UbiE [Flavihumibacter petaseus]|uniref:Demethylmenaquinone methyltransferase n=1 Tax=Flavihumibacter petaseus NBRC 106054 TaxID=1220578 RepID=A0A0E9N5L7_9BACT|nr:bifunctional demethylmenaquinone methyltransferase/2-methoxy-6-polyprenyl-1,4-benzoquinol methylase UbiE [Flavihumibacter petaseus]GAO44976.1 menaquinone biosynthesis methyltransferase UbiE [Flavihumibacter petaseus NBRC 106054]
MSNSLPHDSITPFGEGQLTKKQQVAEMFDRIAFRYDFLNRFLSGGIDIYWRRKAIASLKEINPQHILDVATGTADLSLMAMKYLQPQSITGIDISGGMLELGRKKVSRAGLQDRIRLLQADAENLPFEDNSFDAVMVAFGVRNFENLPRGLKEMQRVLKPGGKLVILEFSKPRRAVFSKLYQWYMNRITPGIGSIISRNREAYRYLNDSVKAFPEGEALQEIISGAGFSDSRFKPLSWCISTLYTGYKPKNLL